MGQRKRRGAIVSTARGVRTTSYQAALQAPPGERRDAHLDRATAAELVGSSALHGMLRPADEIQTPAPRPGWYEQLDAHYARGLGEVAGGAALPEALLDEAAWADMVPALQQNGEAA